LKQNIDIADENLAEASKEDEAAEMGEAEAGKKPNRFFAFLDRLWKPRQQKKRNVKKIVIYKPKSQFRKFVTLMAWILFLFTLGFVFIKGYNFTNTLVTEISKFDAETAIGAISEENEKNIYIPSNSTTKQIAKVLMDEGIIVNDTYFWVYSMLMGNEGNYKSGNHIIDASVTYDDGEIDLITAEGYEMLIYILSQNGVPNPTVKLFFTEGLTTGQTVKIFTDKGIADEDEFLNVCNTYNFNYDFINQIPDDKRRTNRLDGYLFPDTYIFDTTADESTNIKKMLDNFNSKFNETYRAKAAELGYTMDEILIIASLLEKEAATMDERAMIAGVIYNRLKAKDESLHYLQIDATIEYIYINETGAVKEILTTEDHQILNSYNTYMYAGLTPGPICNPSLSSIAAALYPEVHNYYYYVAKNDGTDAHAYATTLAQHNYNVSIYSK
jgi:UPF0755 protein